MKRHVVSKKVAAALAIGTLFSVNQVLAAEETEFQLDQTVVTADRIPQTVAATPSNVTVITQQELQNKGAHTLSEALSGVTGVLIQNLGGTGDKSIAYILGSDRVVVLMDGKRMNLPQGIGFGAAGVDLNTILIGDQVDHIEVVHGGTSVLYGADAVGGVINIITKKGQESKTTYSNAVGNYGGRYYSLATSGQNQNTHWQISGVQDSSDGQRPNNAHKSKSGSVRIDQDLSKGEDLTFTYDYYGSHAGVPGSLSYPTPSDYQNILQHTWSFGYSKEGTDGTRILRYYDNDQIYSGSNYGTGFRHHNTVKSFEYQDSARLDAANLLTWGSEYRKDKVVSTAEGNTLHEDTTKAVYLQDRYSFNSASSLTVGLRRDANDLYGTHWLPQAAYLYQANDKISYFSNWSKVFKAPKFDDLYGDDGFGNTGNPNLKSEKGWTAETGVKAKLNDVSEASVSVFKRNLTDAIRWMPQTDATYGIVYHPRNLDQYHATGVNASFTTKLSPAVTADFGYTYLDSRDGNDKSVGDPRNTFHVGLNLHDGKLNQSIYGVYQDKSGPDLTQIPGRFIVNTHTDFKLNKDVALYLSINNLFNKQYQGVSGYPGNSRTFLLGVKRDL